MKKRSKIHDEQDLRIPDKSRAALFLLSLIPTLPQREEQGFPGTPKLDKQVGAASPDPCLQSSVCVRESERDRQRQRQRERESMQLCLCPSTCISVLSREDLG